MTEAKAHSDIKATTQILLSKNNEMNDNVFHLRWHQLYKTFEQIYSCYSSFEKAIVGDLMNYLDKLGLSQITLAFQYIQQVLKECQRLIFKIDNLMAPEWNNLYGNRIIPYQLSRRGARRNR